jgi:hypothetical protein
MPEERREDPRHTVTLTALWEGLSGRHEARVSDLSLGGCFINSYGKVELGEFILFKIKLPRGTWLELRGQVASIDKDVGFSLAFTFLTEDEQKALAPLLAN